MKSKHKITWTNVRVKLGDLNPWKINPRTIDEEGSALLGASIDEFSQTEVFLIGPNNELYDGHQRLKVWTDKFGAEFEVDARQSNRVLTARERKKLVVLHHRGATGEWDKDMLKENFNFDDLLEWGFKELELLDFGFEEEPKPPAPEAEMDKADELQEKWQVRTGNLFQVGSHRIICGDCTDAAVVARVMDGFKCILLHADPPYGMGKENEGIENDNLYREKLDAFQMAWWKSARPSCEDNASVYIWGQSEDLWRLWFCGGLNNSERLTFRNEIVWMKRGAQGIASEAHRQYPTASERCLFFMIGEQGFNINADNYFEGWTPILEYLEKQRQAMGWSIKDTKRIAGHSEKSGCHWFDKSQWSMPTVEVYNAWKAEAEGKAFKRDYEELKRDFYATRAYFDNAHDNMTDVWSFDRVQGEERFDHATPKPVLLTERIVKSSSADGAIVLDPFSGSGTTLVACERLKRKGRAIEIAPKYVAVALERLSQMGLKPKLIK